MSQLERIKCVIISLFVFSTALSSARAGAVFVLIVSVSPESTTSEMLIKISVEWMDDWWHESQWAFSGLGLLIMPFLYRFKFCFRESKQLRSHSTPSCALGHSHHHFPLPPLSSRNTQGLQVEATSFPLLPTPHPTRLNLTQWFSWVLDSAYLYDYLKQPSVPRKVFRLHLIYGMAGKNT